MARFYFDVSSGYRLTVDESGEEFDDLNEVRDAAISIIASVAQDEMPATGRRRFTITVRNAAEHVVVKVTIDAQADEQPAAEELD